MTIGDVLPGSPEPLGATFTGEGVNFAVFSEWASRMDVCIFEDANPTQEVRRFALREKTRNVWHGYVPGLKPGTLYGLRASGSYTPEKGLRFNPMKLLVDPYARAISGKVDWKQPMFAYPLGDEDQDLEFDARDNGPGVPKSVVVDDHFDWTGEVRPKIPWHQTILYELHVKGFTRSHPDVPPELRGTYEGLAHPAVIDHLKHLGVTTLELLPVHEAVDEPFLVNKGLSNYWGYNTLGFFAPDQRFSRQGALHVVSEFKSMVKALHSAGFEVVLDVVYNHTCEGNHLGPMLSFKGLDNLAYYHLKTDEPRYYMDYTGTGNSVNVGHPQTLKLVMDSLRYWVQEMHVDGFRFDLATTLGRTQRDYERTAPFFQAIHQDPVLSQVKLIAEPWDVGDGGYQLANFPVEWTEWNGKYRDAFREYWRGDDSKGAEIGYRLTGSSDLFKISGRQPSASINFITCHDGFTLHDLVTYNRKHNDANQEGGRDGSDDNRSWNCGVEGESTDPTVVAVRERQKRNFLATLLLSGGVPMLTAGDEMGRTQQGNNNGYCQDSELAWVDWTRNQDRKLLLDFTRRMVWLRRQEPVLQRRRFFEGAPVRNSVLKDATWFKPDGVEMTAKDWANPKLHALAYLLGGDAIPNVDDLGKRVAGNTLLVLMNALNDAVSYTLPDIRWGAHWEIVEDTADLSGHKRDKQPAGSSMEIAGRSLVVLRRAAASVAA